MIRQTIAVAALALTLSGCAIGDAANSSSNLQQELDHKAIHMKENTDFLLDYVLMLQGKKPFPTDDLWCKPADLGELTRPCESMEPDQGGKP